MGRISRDDARETPTRMHVKSIAINGTPEWSPEFKRLIFSLMPVSITQERADWRDWWRSPYVVDQLTKRFGADVVNAVLRNVRDGEHYLDIVAETHHSIPVLARRERQMNRRVRRLYLPYSDRPW